MTTVNLGTTWEEAVKSAYMAGYYRFKHSIVEPKQRLEELQNDGLSEREALDVVQSEHHIDTMIHEGIQYKRFWWEIEDFYDEHMPEDIAEQFKREAAVAEDLVSAYDGGAYAALLQNEPDRDDISHFYG